MPIRHTNESFIKKAKEIHEDIFDYSLVDYKNNRTKIKIVCSVHGIFEQVPDVHLRGFGCSKCSNCYKPTTDGFINRAKLIHGVKYDYSLTAYINSNVCVTIICSIHGCFEKRPNAHLNKKEGCPKCNSVNFKIDTDEFIKRAIKKHGNIYDYSLVEYTNDSTKVKIGCSEHGTFEQRPNVHLKGSGCIICSGRYRYTNDDFIAKSIEKHGILYNYSNVRYTNAHIKVDIICNKHGIFSQKPNSHLSGQGCPKCMSSKGESVIMDYLNSNKIDYIHNHKFDDCKYKYRLRFDFYLPKRNMCIEYDGAFHFIDKFGGKTLANTQLRDSIKDKYCLDNNIEMVRIKYTEFNNISSILDKILK